MPCRRPFASACPGAGGALRLPGFFALLAIVLPIGCNMSDLQWEKKKTNPYENVRAGERGPPVTQSPAIDPTTVPTRDDIVSIVQFWLQEPWIRDNATGKVLGFKVTTYFYSSETEKGAFVPGKVYLWLSLIGHTKRNEAQRVLLHTWELDQAAAMNFRIRKLVAMGYPYQFILKWPEDLDLSGRVVEIQAGYQRADGTLVRGSAKPFKVPAPNGFPTVTSGPH